MSSSTTPSSAEQPHGHRVHRATALLRSALLNSGAPSAAPSQELERISLDAPWGGIAIEPAGITYQGSLSERFGAPALREEIAARSERSAPPELRPDLADIRLHNLAAGVWDGTDANGDAEAFAAGMLLDHGFAAAPQAHVEALVHEFYQRQRRATLLVAGSLAAAVVLTFGGFLLAGSLVAHSAKTGDNRPLSHSTSVAWQRPLGFAPAQFQLASIAANRAAKGEPLLIPAVAHATEPSLGETPSGTQVILATAGRPLALGPLLPPSHARYLFIRGLPAEADLSAGRRSSSGAWFVKDDEDARALALSVGDAAKGDYPVDIYTLESGDAPQARRSLVLRIEAEQQAYQPAASTDWASALLDLMPSPSAALDPVVPANSTVLLKRAKNLLEEGDIAGQGSSSSISPSVAKPMQPMNSHAPTIATR